MSESAQTPAGQGAGSPAGSPQAARTSKSPLIVAAIGAVLVLAAAGGIAFKSGMFQQQGSAETPLLSFVDKSEIGDAVPTLTPSAAGALADDARQCKVPLASMTISRGSAQLGSTIRIRSGSYVSPTFAVTDGIQRVAVPYPAAYSAGAGTLVVEGTATGAVIGLTPTKVMLNLPTAHNIPVVWRTDKPC